MGDRNKPRSGSMQVWPRKRAKRQYPIVRSWANKTDAKDAKALGFAGYKACMMHVMFTDNRKTSHTKGMDVSWPVTVVECPPIKVCGVRFYKNTPYGVKVSKDIMTKADKELGRKISLPKKTKENELNNMNPDDYSDIVILVYTQPGLTGIGKKKPELFEVGIGGNTKQKLDYAKNVLGKEIKVEDVFAEGQHVDIHAVSKGKGFQGPVKRFGVSIRQHKSEKTKRGPGSLGGWKSQGHVMYRVAHAGQMGYHTRTEYNKQILKMDSDVKKINKAGGFKHYGVINNSYLVIKGSLPGPYKRMVRLCRAIRETKRSPKEAPAVKPVLE